MKKEVYGYRLYFDTRSMRFECDSEKTPVNMDECDLDKTTSWFETLEFAKRARESLNKRYKSDEDVFICKTCHKPFFCTKNDQKWFIDKGMHLPKNCITCRKLNKRSNRKGA